MCCVLIQPDFLNNNPDFLFKVLTFTYNGNPGFDGPGATWYVSTLLQLYLVAPFVCRVLHILFKNINEVRRQHIIALLLIFSCVALGLLSRYFSWKRGVDWYSQVYVPFYMNLDLYISGILLNYILPLEKSENSKALIKKICVYLFLLGFILFNIWIYYRENYFVYQYILPSLYIGYLHLHLCL